MTGPVFDIRGLTVKTADGSATIVRDVNLQIAPGEVVALIGESGSGKTTVCLAALGYVRPGLRIVAGSVRLGGTEVLALGDEALRDLRGRRVAYVAQSAAASFNPALTVGDQVIESARVHGILGSAQARARALELYGELGLPEPDRIGKRYPHQVSGGQLQRLMAAMAMCCGPELMVLDEPTTALDVTTQIGVLKAFKDLIRRRGASALYVSHNLAVVAQIADRILVMRNGDVQEEGSTKQILGQAKSPYTRALMAACNRWTAGSDTGLSSPSAAAAPQAANSILDVRGLTAGYGEVSDGGLPRTVAVKAADFSIGPSSVVGVIGESGSGKSTLARAIAGLRPAARGTLMLGGRPLAASVAGRSKDELRRIQIVFQSPDVSLNPAHTVDRIIGRPIEYFRGMQGRQKADRVAELLEMVKLPASLAKRWPNELSGGQKQRVNLARALAAEPDLILCDEVTSALDTIVALSVIELLEELRGFRKLSFLFISHDISTVASFAEEVLVLHRGEIVERGRTNDVLNRPQHPYTKVLVSSVPQLRIGWLESAVAERAHVLRTADAVALVD